MTTITGSFLKILAAGKDSTMLRFSLGSVYLKGGTTLAAGGRARPRISGCLQAARPNPGSGRAAGGCACRLSQRDRRAEPNGDQAAKEMTVFARRIEKRQA